MKFVHGILLGLLSHTLAQDSSTAYVDLATTQGESSKNASGFIYGMPLNYDPNDIPDHFYTDIDIKWGRAGGAQLDTPCRGWAFGFEEYKCRFNATMLNYKQTRKFGATFIILPHDIWGIDYRSSISNHKMPGDNNDWTSYDDFLDELVRDLKANGALEGLVWDIWNEPDQPGFWGRPIQQWVDLYIRTHKKLRSDSDLDNVLISGPTTSSSPSMSNDHWTLWAMQIAGNRTYPDQYAWHYGDPDVDHPNFLAVLSQYDLPLQPVNLNEYALLEEMTPSGYAWWLSRLERYNYAGLLGLWKPPLYDNFANLLTKSPGDPQDENNDNYVGAAGFSLYKYYATSMSGQRAKTKGSSDGRFDCFVTIGDKVRILAGSRVAVGNFTLQLEGLEAVGYALSDTLDAVYYAFHGSDDIFEPFGDPDLLGIQSVPVEHGVAKLNVYVPDKHTGWKIEFERK
ncbi:hypothetical protein LB504_005009 [Fusarium proliferatum]|nr:hypothetical protein LB504_005009 [Fusarium proliferatum]